MQTATRMVVLSERPDDVLRAGFTPERLAVALAELRDRFGMPIDTSVRPRVAASLPACRAVVAARRHVPGRADALLRRLRVHHFALAGLLDDAAVLAAAAAEAGIDADDLVRWMGEPDTETALREDMRAARSPLPAARALDHKLGGPREERRYTCPSWVVRRDGRAPLVAPGFQPVEVYEVLIANLAPELARRPAAASAVDVLRWAREPLAAPEIAAVLGVDLEAAVLELERVAEPDRGGFWTLAPRFERVAATASR